MINTDYMINLRREIHMYPEVDFDLPKTVALVKRELDSLGIPYTEKYGKGSVVGYINPDKSGFTIGIRAELDALKMNEKNDCEYRSRNEGMMHACGHDANTAILLGTAKALKETENNLECRVKLIFQPSEEGVISGAAMMIEKGVLEDVDIMLGVHAIPTLNTGELGICPGKASATCRHFKIEIKGKSTHATAYHKGIDALAVAVRLYTGIQNIVTTEIPPEDKAVCVVTKLNSGTAQNVISDYSLMEGTIRTFSVPLSEFIYERISGLAKSVSEQYGAEISVHAPLLSSCVDNNPKLCELLIQSMKKVAGEDKIRIIEQKLGSDDFSWYTDVVPSALFRLGIRNEKKGITQGLHQSDFQLDEDSLKYGAETLVQFILDNHNGIDFNK